jgi:hypothetical protein
MQPEKEVTREVVVVAPAAPPTFMELIAQNVTNPDFDAGKLNALIDANERVKKIQAEIDFNADMLELQKQLPTIKKTGEIDYGKGAKPIKFAKIEDIEKEIRKIYLPLGFRMSFDQDGDTHIGIVTHRNGHKEISHIKVPPDNGGGKNPIQGVVSSGSYAQRILLKRLLNLVFEGDDDDGAGGQITTEQAVELDQLLRESGMDREKFLKLAEAPDVQSITLKAYGRSLNAVQAMILRKQRQAEKEKANATNS